jgi:2-keto-4-pentenoate hydratase/2-oxohepta-3-ene-1,7-dioic acid hydratase in catechol pathway
VRLISFTTEDSTSFGLAVDGGVIDCGARLPAGLDLHGVLQAGGIAGLEAFASTPVDYRHDEVRYLPVITNPGAKFLCIGINYRPHMQEMGREPPDYPVVFVRFQSSFVGHRQPMIRPSASEQFDFEGELTVVIGTRARQVPREQALDHVAGYTCLNDGSVRDFQRHSGQFTPGKNFVASGSIGPWLVTRDEIADPAALELTTRLNGDVVQHERTGELIFGIPELIEYLSIWTELLPGDVIATGTPGGVGAGRKPPLWMKAGDNVEVEISRIGVLGNRIVDQDAA